MKKILAALLVLAFAIPAMADVAVTWEDLGSGHLQIKVAPTGGAAVRGVALKLTRTAGDAAIESATDPKVAVTEFNTMIDYAFSNAGYTIGAGHPLAKPDQAGELVDFPASTFSLCAGYLDASKAGVVVDSFFDVFYTLTSDSTITIELDTLRGGIVGDTLGTVTVASPAILIGAPVPCNVSKPTIVKTTAAPAVAGLVNGSRAETFVASATSDQGHALQYQFTWGDGNVSDWGSDTQDHTYSYAAAATYNVTVQARCTVDGALSVASDALVEATEPVKSTAAIYADWAAFGRKDCWAFTRNCNGDADGKRQGTAGSGYKYVSSNDLTVLVAAWNINEPTKGVGMAGINVTLPTNDTINGICADFNRDRQGTSGSGYKRVSSNDLPILVANWNINEPTKGAGVPSCFATGHYHYMINP